MKKIILLTMICFLFSISSVLAAWTPKDGWHTWNHHLYHLAHIHSDRGPWIGPDILQVIVDGVEVCIFDDVYFQKMKDGEYVIIPPPSCILENPNIIHQESKTVFYNETSLDSKSFILSKTSVEDVESKQNLTSITIPTQQKQIVNVSSQPVKTISIQKSIPIKDLKTFIINIPKRKEEGFLPVTLIITDEGFIGPQGELYQKFPKVKLLQELYGN